MFNKIEMRLSGSGGQGVILAAIIFADAALADGLNAIQTQSYGPEARGGASKAEVIISDSEIKYPKVLNNGILLSLTQKALDKYLPNLKKDGILVVDESVNVPETFTGKVYSLPILRTAEEKLGTLMVGNIVSIGVLYGIMGENIINVDTIKKSIADRVPPATIDKNMKAFEEGLKLVRG